MPLSGPGIRSLGSRKPGLTIFQGTSTPVPKTISGLLAWYDFSTLGLSDGTAIASVTDGSGNTHDLSQATVGSRPTFKTNIQNGRSVARFLRANSQWMASSSFAAGTVALTHFAVCTVANSTDSFPMIVTFGSGNYELRFNTTTLRPELEGGGAVGALATAAVTVNTFHVLEGSFDQATDAVAVAWDGANAATVTDTNNPTMTQPITVGARTGGSLFHSGDIGEVLTYNRLLTAGEKTTIRAYLKAKWGTP